MNTFLSAARKGAEDGASSMRFGKVASTTGSRRDCGRRSCRSWLLLLILSLAALYTLVAVGTTDGSASPARLSLSSWRKIQAQYEAITASLARPGRPSRPVDVQTMNGARVLEAAMKACESQAVFADRIQCRFHAGQAHLEALRARQSKTVDEAVKAYRARYGREPPSGFAQWAQYALDQGSVIIDDYDQLESDMAPFRQYSGAQLRQRIQTAFAKFPHPTLGMFNISQGTFNMTWQPDFHLRTGIYALADPLAPKLPDLQILYNWDDRCHIHAQPVDMGMEQQGWYGDSAWSVLTQTCPVCSIAEIPANVARPHIDLCKQDNQQRAALVKQHATFNSYGSAFTNLVPMLSSVKLSTYQDILVPRVEYSVQWERGWGEREDKVPFAEKKDSLYWRGSSSGSMLTELNWLNGHRSRFVLTLQAWGRLLARLHDSPLVMQDIKAQSDLPALHLAKKGALEALARLPPDFVQVGFSRVKNCMPEGQAYCDKLIALSPPKGKAMRISMYEHKFVFDLDGNGMSGRFYRLLESQSLVFKQTIFSEWHDERILPWLHYIPVDLEYSELPQLLDFFANHAEGKKLAEQIAGLSRTWAGEALRAVDQSIYLYRVLLEYAALLNR